MLASLNVLGVFRKLSFCECMVFESHQSSSVGVHPCISFKRMCDFVGNMCLHQLNYIVCKHCRTRNYIRERLKNKLERNMLRSYHNDERSALVHN